MTQFEIIMQTDTPELPAEIGNFEEVKAAIQDALQQYNTDAAVTTETVKDAEKTRAHLRRVKEQIETYRKDAKAAYLERFGKLETQCRELSGLIEQPISAIDSKIKKFENEENMKKWTELNLFFNALEPPAWLELADIINLKWKNKTATLSKLKEEISTAVCNLKDDFAALETVYGKSELWTAIADKFYETKNKSQTLVYAAQLERQHSEEQKKADVIQKAREEAAQNAISGGEDVQAVYSPENTQNAAQRTDDAPAHMISGTFRVTGTREQIKALAVFLKQTGIRFEIVK